MATTAARASYSTGVRDERRFFLILALAMAAVNVAGFSLHWFMGRSTFGAPPLVHLHAGVFFGWIALFVTQTALAARGSLALHRRLGWVAAGWAVAMVVLGIAITVLMVREGRAPFFFTPAYFLVMNSLSVLTFGALVAVAIRLRRKNMAHRRLMIVGMAAIMAPALGRILPLPLLIPWAGWSVFVVVILFPLAGVIHDYRRTGRVHPAWLWGIAALFVMQLAMDVLSSGDTGRLLYATAVAGSPGEAIALDAYPPFPPIP